MYDFSMKLYKDSTRPVIQLDNGLYAMLDFGALYPVWVLREDTFKKYYPDAELIEDDFTVSGFGQSRGKRYRATIKVGEFIYPKIKIAVCPLKNVNFQLLLSASMFQNAITEIDTLNHNVTFKVRDRADLIRTCGYIDYQGNYQYLTINDADKEDYKKIAAFYREEYKKITNSNETLT